MNLSTQRVITTQTDLSRLNFEKTSNGAEHLLPAIIQDANTSAVLMLGFMNREAAEKTLREGVVTFFSRTKGRLWTKGETSGHVLRVAEILADCDGDTLLIKAHPAGPVCHTGDDTCFGESNGGKSNSDEARTNDDPFLHDLERIILDRKHNPSGESYTSKLLAKGINKVAQKVGEEAVELVIEAKDQNDDLFIGEAADLLFHTLVLLAAKDVPLNRVLMELRRRHKPRS
jgi:phosphoribosyl-ATP pyrophosphohydrolase/phosphoribosyl-AMP cyclohydrolase